MVRRSGGQLAETCTGVTAPMIAAATEALLSEGKSGVLTISQVLEPAELLAGRKKTHRLALEQAASHDHQPS
jgi:hypothetical protein